MYIDLKNDLYNLNTEAEAGNFTFPYPENHFESVVLTSVFTHMMPEDVQNYLTQISRVMKKEGRCLATFFLLNPEVSRLMQEDKIPFQFPHPFGGYSLMDKKVKEANVAFEETFLFAMLEKSGLQAESVHRGRWSNGKAPLDFQDVVIIKRSRFISFRVYKGKLLALLPTLTNGSKSTDILIIKVCENTLFRPKRKRVPAENREIEFYFIKKIA